MKTHNVSFSIFISIICILLLSCTFNIVSKPCSDKTPKKEVRNLDKFDGIELSVAADIQLTQGTPQKLEIEGRTCDLENIVTKINGSSLHIKNDHSIFGTSREKVTIYITVQDINKLSIAGSGSIFAKSAISINDLRLNIAGSGSINIPDLKATNVNSSIAGSGSIEISGKEKLEKHSIDIAGSGDVKAKDILTSIAEINIMGSGSCYLNVADKIKAHISGSGDIFYAGKPSVESSVAGSGKIKPL